MCSRNCHCNVQTLAVLLIWPLFAGFKTSVQFANFVKLCLQSHCIFVCRVWKFEGPIEFVQRSDQVNFCLYISPWSPKWLLKVYSLPYSLLCSPSGVCSFFVCREKLSMFPKEFFNSAKKCSSKFLSIHYTMEFQMAYESMQFTIFFALFSFWSLQFLCCRVKLSLSPKNCLFFFSCTSGY